MNNIAVILFINGCFSIETCSFFDFKETIAYPPHFYSNQIFRRRDEVL